MTKNIVFVLFLSLCITSCAQKIVSNRDRKTFEYHFRILDSVAAKTNGDTLVNITEPIAFMENKTDIEASSDGTYFGRLAGTKSDLDNWHKWFNENLNKKRRKKAKIDNNR